jgi:hypothetical protein
VDECKPLDLGKGEEVFMKYFDVTMPRPDRAAVARKWGFVCACKRCAMEGVGEEAAAAAWARAEALGKVAGEAARAAPASKKAGSTDRDGAAAVGPGGTCFLFGPSHLCLIPQIQHVMLGLCPITEEMP